MLRKQTLLLLAWLATWTTCTFCSLGLQPVDPSLDHDEIYWIGSSYYYDLAFVQWDWNHPAWRLLPARENPPVAKYVIGLGLAAADYHITSIDNLSYFYLFWLGWEKNPDARSTGPDTEKRSRVVDAATPGFRKMVLEKMRAPLTRPVVQAARNTILGCAAVASLLLFLFGMRAKDNLSGLFASQLLLWQPAVVGVTGHAMSDAVAMMFSIGAALSVLCWYMRFSQPGLLSFKSTIASTLATGILLALACGAKMNSLIIVILAGVLVAWVAGKKWADDDHRGAIKTGIHGLLILLTALAVFVLINPAIMLDIPGGLAATMSEHSRSLVIQTDIGHTNLHTLSAKFAAIIWMGFYNVGTFTLLMTIIGWSILRRWNHAVIRFAVCWWVVAFVCVAMWIPLAWPRYVIPVIIPSVWLVGYYAAEIIRYVARISWRQIDQMKQPKLNL